MQSLQLSEISQMINATLQGSDAVCSGVSTDTRSLKAGDLFVALEGPSFNGHDFMSKAEEAKASAVMVHQKVETTLPQLQVSNTQFALGELAKQYRQRFHLPIAVVTGSTGKTTVKEMTALILAQAGKVLANVGNFNNEIGLPLTLLQLDDTHQYGMIELGARKVGDIAYLANLVAPSIAAITNIGVAHLGIFGSRPGIAKAKGEIYQSLPKDGIAIWNAEDEFLESWKKLLKGQRVISFGFGKSSNITCQNILVQPQYSEFDLITDIGTIPIHLPVPGTHNILNALTAVAIARAFNMSLDAIQTGLKTFKNVTGRLQIKAGLQGSCVIDDTYNANPQSVIAALSVLSTYPQEKIFVMGDMVELGDESLLLHKGVGEKAKEFGIHKMFSIGTLTPSAIEGFGRGRHFDNKEALIAALLPLLHKDVVVLVKGSRAMRMEEIVLAITAK